MIIVVKSQMHVAKRSRLPAAFRVFVGDERIPHMRNGDDSDSPRIMLFRYLFHARRLVEQTRRRQVRCGESSEPVTPGGRSLPEPLAQHRDAAARVGILYRDGHGLGGAEQDHHLLAARDGRI